jgi:hypothetical protein
MDSSSRCWPISRRRDDQALRRASERTISAPATASRPMTVSRGRSLAVRGSELLLPLVDEVSPAVLLLPVPVALVSVVLPETLVSVVLPVALLPPPAGVPVPEVLLPVL